MNKKLLAGFATAGLLLLASVVPALAVPITYTLKDVTFTDGATATGSFVFDAATGQGLSFNVSTTAGILSAFTYEDASSGFYLGNGAGPNNFILFADNGQRYFNFSFLNPLSDAGGTYAVLANSYECDNCSPFRFVASGSVTSLAAEVPEPGSIALLLPSLGLLGFAVRRRKQSAA